MRKKFVCEFLNVSRPFQANWAWRGASSRGLSLITINKIQLKWKLFTTDD
jgi:hypothetical protein